MTKVDFYILTSDSDTERLNFCCRLLDKAVRQGNRILVRTRSEQESIELDQRLWDFRPESYIPHAVIHSATETSDMPLVISHHYQSDQHHDVLVNLNDQLPDHFAHYKRLAQIVDQQTQRLQQSRQHYSFFKERGYPISVNQIGKK